MFEKILCFLFRVYIAPLIHFWDKAFMYKRKKEYGKMVAAFAVSFFTVIAMAASLGALIVFLVFYGKIVLLIIGGIAWVYWMVKVHYADKKTQSPTEVSTMTSDETELYKCALTGYNPMHNILFLVLKKCGNDISVKIPRTKEEIELPDDKFIIENDCIFYEFIAYKKDIHSEYLADELMDIKEILQNTFERLWKGREFLAYIKIQPFYDSNNNPYPPVTIDRVDDVGSKLLIQVVYTTPTYLNYKCATKDNTGLPDYNYIPNDRRFL